MKLVCVSKSIKLQDKKSADNIHLFTQYFIPSNKHRHDELKKCLKLNALNRDVYKIHLLVERTYTISELGTSSDKIIQTVLLGLTTATVVYAVTVINQAIQAIKGF